MSKKPVGRPKVDGPPKSKNIRVSYLIMEELEKIGDPRKLIEEACLKFYKIKTIK